MKSHLVPSQIIFIKHLKWLGGCQKPCLEAENIVYMT